MKHANADKRPLLDQAGAVGHLICTRHHRDFIELRLEPEAGIPVHVQDFYIDFIVASGHGRITVEDEDHPVGPGDVVHAEPRQRRGLRNTGSEPLLIYAIRQHRERSVTSSS